MIFQALNFCGHFEALNDDFFGLEASPVIAIGFGVGPFYYFTPQHDLSNGLSSDPNEYRMKTLQPGEVDMPTYHFKVHKTIGTSSYRLMLRVHPTKRSFFGAFHCCVPQWDT